MLKRYTFWLWVAVVFLFVNALAHLLSFIITPVPHNETERQLFDLMANYQMDMGAGIHRSMNQLVTALSSCLTLICLLAALTNIFLLRKKVEPSIVKGLVGIQVFVFGILFGLVVVFAFLPPMVLSGLMFVSLAVTFFLTPTQRTR